MHQPIKLIIEELLFSPLIFFIFILGVILWPLRGKKQYHHPKLLWLLGICFLLIFLSTETFFQWFSYPLKQMIPESQKNKADAIVVASAGVLDSGSPTQGSAARAYAAAQLYLEKWAPLVIVTGGVTRPYTPPVEVKGMHIVLKGMGVLNDDIVIEDKSVNTYMNGVETIKILNKLELRKIILVSHDYHLPRLVAVFEKHGIEVFPYAANQNINTEVNWWEYFDWDNFNRLQTIAHEYIGLFTYKMFGRI